MLNDPVIAQYTHNLTVIGRLGESYTCTVANNKPSSASLTTHITPESNVHCSMMKHLIDTVLFTVPSAAPEMFVAVAGVREVVFTWSPPPPTQLNRIITNYNLSCSPPPSSTPPFFSLSLSLTVAGFSPNTLYSCSVMAINRQGAGPLTSVSFTTKPDCNPELDCYLCEYTFTFRCVLSS